MAIDPVQSEKIDSVIDFEGSGVIYCLTSFTRDDGVRVAGFWSMPKYFLHGSNRPWKLFADNTIHPWE